MKIFKRMVGCYLSIQTLFLSITTHAQNLDFGNQDSAQVVSQESLFPYSSLTLGFFSIYVGLGLLLLSYFIFKKRKEWEPPVFLESEFAPRGNS